MDIGIANIVTEMASGTTQALSTYKSVFLLVGGIVLAMAIIERVIGFFVKDDTPDTIENNH
jgi:hypothetical protein